MNNKELQHHGILGMRWGVRRFQNEDGGLTIAGRMRQAKLKRKRRKALKKARATKAAKKKAELKNAKKKKSVHDMTDEEINAALARRELEKRYLKEFPEKQSKGKKFIKGVVNDVIAPAAKEAGQAYAKKLMKDLLGIDNKTASSLAKQVEKTRQQKDLLENLAAIKKLQDKDYTKIKYNEEISRMKKNIKDNEQSINGETTKSGVIDDANSDLKKLTSHKTIVDRLEQYKKEMDHDDYMYYYGDLDKKYFSDKKKKKK